MAGALADAGRRRCLHAALVGSLSLGAPARASSPARVLVLGAGWGGLAAAHALSQAGEGVDVTLVDRHAEWWSLPLSNPWLVGRLAGALPRVDLAEWARRHGLRFVRADVQGLDRHRRELHTADGRLAYDWLLLAPGISYDDDTWYGGDAQAAARSRHRFPPGFMAAELPLLRERLLAFQGGTLVVSVPPAPYRCPPAPYERALLLAAWMDEQRLPGRIVVLDAGGGMARLVRLFGRGAAARIEHRSHSPVRAVNLKAQVISTDVDELRFDHAMPLPPQHAGALLREAGLTDAAAPGWAAVDPATLQARADERIFVVGDALGPVSPLFGAYPKTAHVAAQLGSAAAAQVLARVRGQAAAAPLLPRSECHVWTQASPPEQIMLEASHRLRADGVLVQTVRQHDNTQPRGEAEASLRTLLRERLGVALG